MVRIEIEKIDAPRILILVGLGLVLMLWRISLAVVLAAEAGVVSAALNPARIRAERVRVAHHRRAFNIFILCNLFLVLAVFFCWGYGDLVRSDSNV